MVATWIRLAEILNKRLDLGLQPHLVFLLALVESRLASVTQGSPGLRSSEQLDPDNKHQPFSKEPFHSSNH